MVIHWGYLLVGMINHSLFNVTHIDNVGEAGYVALCAEHCQSLTSYEW